MLGRGRQAGEQPCRRCARDVGKDVVTAAGRTLHAAVRRQLSPLGGGEGRFSTVPGEPCPADARRRLLTELCYGEKQCTAEGGSTPGAVGSSCPA